MPPVDPPKKGHRSWSNPVRRGRPLLNRKQVQKVARSYSNRRKKSREPVEAPKPLPPKRPGGLSYRFSTAWADVKDDDDQELRLVSYADSSDESLADEAAYTKMMVEALVQERDNQRPGTRGNGSRSGSQSSNGGRKKIKRSWRKARQSVAGGDPPRFFGVSIFQIRGCSLKRDRGWF